MLTLHCVETWCGVENEASANNQIAGQLAYVAPLISVIRDASRELQFSTLAGPYLSSTYPRNATPFVKLEGNRRGNWPVQKPTVLTGLFFLSS